jgi:hypothetical protein
MKPDILFLSLALLVGPVSLFAERGAADSDRNTEVSSSGEGSAVNRSSINPQPAATRPFSVGSTTFGVSSLGIQLQFASNLNRRMGLRSGFDVLPWKKWTTYGGFTFPATVSMGSINTSFDFYPFANHGLRFSPGILIHTTGVATSPIQLAPIRGGAFSLNGHTYYSTYTPSSNPDPRAPAPGPEPAITIQSVQLRPAAFTFSTGWENMLPRKEKGSWSFPVEAGFAFLGSPEIKTLLIKGQICDPQFQNCQDAATNPEFQSDLHAQFGAYKTRLDFFRTYPIISIGVAYHYRFSTRSH